MRRYQRRRTLLAFFLFIFLWFNYKLFWESSEWQYISNIDNVDGLNEHRRDVMMGDVTKSGVDVRADVDHAKEHVTPSRPDLTSEAELAKANSSLEQCAFSVGSFGASPSSECVLPTLDPFNEHIMKFLVGSKDRIDCPGKQYTTYKNGVLSIAEKDTTVKDITVHSIERKPQSDFGFQLKREVFQYPQSTFSKLDKEFLQVNIVKSSGEEIVEYHAKVIARPEVFRRKEVTGGLGYNVLMLGFDSTSAAQMQRAMPEVYRFLKDDLNSFIFRGYSIVGDGTTPQLTAMLTGQTESELPEARVGYPNSSTVDSWPWIFNDFRKHGYATMYSEDDSMYNAFNYRLHGFKEPPTDHYSRTFWQAAPTEQFCVQSIPQPQLHFSYVESFMEAYRTVPKFVLAFLSNVCHDSMTNLRQATGYTLSFLKSLKQKGFLDDTILIVFGDHGTRFGEARALIQSKLEERLPFLSIALPNSSRLMYREIHSFLRENLEKLTSPFDMHATLHHILTYSKGYIDPQKIGMSLFRRIPSDRGCSQCGIPDHYCPCVQLKDVPSTHPHVKLAAQGLVQRINALLDGDQFAAQKCAKLQLREIKSAYQNLNHPKLVQFRGSEDIDGRIPKFEKNATYFECNYAFLIRTDPGGGLFEATAQLIRGRFYFGQEISRINKYGNQPKCIAMKRPYLRKFCYCKEGNA